MRKGIIAAVGAAAAVLSIAACGSSGATTNGNQQESSQQTADTSSLEQSQPIPHFDYSQIRQTLIDAETIAADGTQTTSFFFQMGDPNPVFTCPSIGMPVANTAQLSNPSQAVWDESGQSPAGATIGQQDPYGIYSPSASTGTYVICVNNSGQKYLQYWEGDVMSVTSGATWDAATHSVSVTGAPTYQIHTKSGS